MFFYTLSLTIANVTAKCQTLTGYLFHHCPLNKAFLKTLVSGGGSCDKASWEGHYNA